MSTATAANMGDEDEKEAHDSSVATDTSNASTAATVLQGPRPRVACLDVDWLFTAQGDTPLVTIKCGNDKKSFVVMKSILTRKSEFFENCLKTPWAESQTSIFHLPDIETDYMELYLTLATRQALMNTHEDPDLTPLVQLTDFDDGRLPELLLFYKTCDYLQNRELAEGTHEMICGFLMSHRGHDNNDGWRMFFQEFAEAFDLITPGHSTQVELQRHIVETFCDNISSQVYFENCSVLRGQHDDFVFEVARQFAFNAMWGGNSTTAKAEKYRARRMEIDDNPVLEYSY